MRIGIPNLALLREEEEALDGSMVELRGGGGGGRLGALGEDVKKKKDLHRY